MGRKPNKERRHAESTVNELRRKCQIRKVGLIDVQAAIDAMAFDCPHPPALSLTELTGIGSLVRIHRDQLNTLDSEVFEVMVCLFEMQSD